MLKLIEVLSFVYPRIYVSQPDTENKNLFVRAYLIFTFIRNIAQSSLIHVNLVFFSALGMLLNGAVFI